MMADQVHVGIGEVGVVKVSKESHEQKMSDAFQLQVASQFDTLRRESEVPGRLKDPANGLHRMAESGTTSGKQ